MKLHLGCGPRIIEGWCNYDRHPVNGADFMDVTRVFPFQDESATHIYCEDLFEHLSQKEQLSFLYECRRVMVAGGLLRITCPELTASLLREADPWHWGHLLIPTKTYMAELGYIMGFDTKLDDGGQAEGFPEDKRPHEPRQPHENIFIVYRKPH